MLNTDIVVAAMRGPRGGSAELVSRVCAQAATMLLSVALAVEYEAKCMQPEHRLAAGLSAAEAELFVDRLIALAEPVQSYFRWRPQLQDPCDELVLEAGVNGRASAIVTFNEKYLREAERSFGIAVIRPAEALRRINS